jgi:prepilin signal peptidase PulO-like enzyme (type II secretory pathway)
MMLLLAAPYAIFGAILASFAGVISERLYTGESWMRSRSRCNSCNRPLTAPDLIPIISWVIFRGRCRTCRAPVPYRYALAELVLGALFYAAALALPPTAILPVFLAFLFTLTIAVLYDLRHTIVPMPLALLLIGFGTCYAWLASADRSAFGMTLLVAGYIGFGFFLLHALSRGRWMGLGDAPIALALALVAGQVALAGLLFSFWIGAAVGIAILATSRKGHRMGIEVPFVPFLAWGYLLAIFTQWNPFAILP